MKRPSFQFYPGDWQANSNLKRCTHAEKGVWLDVLCLLHDQPDYGILRWSLKEIAQAVGCSMSLLKGLVSKGILKGSDEEVTEPYIYTPRSGRKDGHPVILIGIQAGPCWYSSRMVKDEYVRTIRGESTRFSEESGEAPKRSPKPPIGDGSSSSSSSSTSVVNTNTASTDVLAPAFPPEKQPAPEPPDVAKPTSPDCPHLKVLELWAEILPAMPQHNADLWRGSRAEHLRARWRETAVSKKWKDQAEGLAYFRKLFAFVGKSPFLTGQTRSSDPNRPPFVIELEWLLLPTNWAKVIEGKYHTES